MPDAPVPAAQDDIAPGATPRPLTQQEKAEQQLRQQEKQRIAGVVPNFNVSYNADAARAVAQAGSCTLAFRTATDPVSFAVAGFSMQA